MKRVTDRVDGVLEEESGGRGYQKRVDTKPAPDGDEKKAVRVPGRLGSSAGSSALNALFAQRQVAAAPSAAVPAPVAPPQSDKQTHGMEESVVEAGDAAPAVAKLPGKLSSGTLTGFGTLFAQRQSTAAPSAVVPPAVSGEAPQSKQVHSVEAGDAAPAVAKLPGKLSGGALAGFGMLFAQRSVGGVAAPSPGTVVSVAEDIESGISTGQAHTSRERKETLAVEASEDSTMGDAAPQDAVPAPVAVSEASHVVAPAAEASADAYKGMVGALKPLLNQIFTGAPEAAIEKNIRDILETYGTPDGIPSVVFENTRKAWVGDGERADKITKSMGILYSFLQGAYSPPITLKLKPGKFDKSSSLSGPKIKGLEEEVAGMTDGALLGAINTAVVSITDSFTEIVEGLAANAIFEHYKAARVYNVERAGLVLTRLPHGDFPEATLPTGVPEHREPYLYRIPLEVLKLSIMLENAIGRPSLSGDMRTVVSALAKNPLFVKNEEGTLLISAYPVGQNIYGRADCAAFNSVHGSIVDSIIQYFNVAEGDALTLGGIEEIIKRNAGMFSDVDGTQVARRVYDVYKGDFLSRNRILLKQCQDSIMKMEGEKEGIKALQKKSETYDEAVKQQQVDVVAYQKAEVAVGAMEEALQVAREDQSGKPDVQQDISDKCIALAAMMEQCNRALQIAEEGKEKLRTLELSHIEALKITKADAVMNDYEKEIEREKGQEVNLKKQIEDLSRGDAAAVAHFDIDTGLTSYELDGQKKTPALVRKKSVEQLAKVFLQAMQTEIFQGFASQIAGMSFNSDISRAKELAEQQKAMRCRSDAGKKEVESFVLEVKQLCTESHDERLASEDVRCVLSEETRGKLVAVRDRMQIMPQLYSPRYERDKVILGRYIGIALGELEVITADGEQQLATLAGALRALSTQHEALATSSTGQLATVLETAIGIITQRDKTIAEQGEQLAHLAEVLTNPSALRSLLAKQNDGFVASLLNSSRGGLAQGAYKQ